MKKIATGILIVAMLIACCNAFGEELTPVTLRLNWTAQGSHAPVWYGLETGIFEECGIKLIAGEGKGSGTTVNVIASKGDMIGYADCGTIFNLISQGAEVKMIAPVYAKLSSAVISIEENNILAPEDLVGKKIGITEGDGPHKLFAAFLKNVEISESDLELVAMDSSAKVTALLTGQVDAILGGFDDQPFQIEKLGHKATVIPYADYGVNVIGMALCAHVDTIAKQPELLSKFIEAYAKSWAAAYNNKDAALDALIAQFPDLDRETASNQFDAAYSCLVSDYSNGICDVAEDFYTLTIELSKEYLGLAADAEAENLYTTAFMPEEPILLK